MLTRDDGKNVVVGDPVKIYRTLTNLPSGETLIEAWLTVKRKQGDAQDDALIEKRVTATSSGDGQITDTGGDGTAALRIDVGSAETLPLRAGRRYWYDIQVVLSNGDKLTLPETDPDPRGWVLDPQITVGPVYTLQMGVQPSAVAADAVITPAIQVTIRRNGEVAEDFDGSCELAGQDGPGGSIGGDTVKAFVGGSATFDDITVDTPGTWTLRFTVDALGDDIEVESAEFTVTP